MMRKSSPSVMFRKYLLSFVLACSLFVSTHGAIVRWKGGAGDTDWYSTSNWESFQQPTDMDEVEISGNVLVVAKRKVRVNSLALTKGAQLQCQDVCEFKTFARVDKDSTLLIEGGVVRSSEGTFRPSPGATGASRIPLRTLSVDEDDFFTLPMDDDTKRAEDDLNIQSDDPSSSEHPGSTDRVFAANDRNFAFWTFTEQDADVFEFESGSRSARDNSDGTDWAPDIMDFESLVRGNAVDLTARTPLPASGRDEGERIMSIFAATADPAASAASKLVIEGQLIMNQGLISGSSTLLLMTVARTGRISLIGEGGSNRFSFARVNVQGTLVWGVENPLVGPLILHSTVLLIDVDGRVDARGPIISSADLELPGTIVNMGVIAFGKANARRSRQAPSSSQSVGVSFFNKGSVSIESGDSTRTFRFLDNFYNAANVTVSVPNLIMGGSNNTFTETSTLTLENMLTMQSGTTMLGGTVNAGEGMGTRGSLIVQAPTHVDGVVSIATVAVTGGYLLIEETGVIAVHNQLEWSSGMIAGNVGTRPGTVSILPSATLRVIAPEHVKVLKHAVLDVQGTLDVLDRVQLNLHLDAHVVLTGGARLLNKPGSSIAADSSSSTLRLTSSNTTWEIQTGSDPVVLDVMVESEIHAVKIRGTGEAKFRKKSTIEAIMAEKGTVVVFQGDNSNESVFVLKKVLNADTALFNSCLVVVEKALLVGKLTVINTKIELRDGAKADIGALYVGASVSAASSTLVGSGQLRVRDLTFYGGEMNVINVTITSTLHLLGSLDKTIGGIEWVVEAGNILIATGNKIRLLETVKFILSTDSVARVGAGAMFFADGSVSMEKSGHMPTLVNHGQFLCGEGGATSRDAIVVGVPFVNHGYVEVSTSNTAEFKAGYTSALPPDASSPRSPIMSIRSMQPLYVLSTDPFAALDGQGSLEKDKRGKALEVTPSTAFLATAGTLVIREGASCLFSSPWQTADDAITFNSVSGGGQLVLGSGVHRIRGTIDVSFLSVSLASSVTMVQGCHSSLGAGSASTCTPPLSTSSSPSAGPSPTPTTGKENSTAVPIGQLECVSTVFGDANPVTASYALLGTTLLFALTSLLLLVFLVCWSRDDFERETKEGEGGSHAEEKEEEHGEGGGDKYDPRQTTQRHTGAHANRKARAEKREGDNATEFKEECEVANLDEKEAEIIRRGKDFVIVEEDEDNEEKVDDRNRRDTVGNSQNDPPQKACFSKVDSPGTST